MVPLSKGYTFFPAENPHIITYAIPFNSSDDTYLDHTMMAGHKVKLHPLAVGNMARTRSETPIHCPNAGSVDMLMI
jgi:hypothetical protein